MFSGGSFSKVQFLNIKVDYSGTPAMDVSYLESLKEVRLDMQRYKRLRD